MICENPGYFHASFVKRILQIVWYMFIDIKYCRGVSYVFQFSLALSLECLSNVLVRTYLGMYSGTVP